MQTVAIIALCLLVIAPFVWLYKNDQSFHNSVSRNLSREGVTYNLVGCLSIICGVIALVGLVMFVLGAIGVATGQKETESIFGGGFVIVLIFGGLLYLMDKLWPSRR